MPRLVAWYRRASLQAKFALHVVLTTAVLFGIVVPVVLYIEREALLSAVEDSGFRIADIFARSSVQAVVADDYLVMQHVVNGISSDRKILYAMLLTGDGEVLVHTRANERGKTYADSASRQSAQTRGPLLQRHTTADGTPVYDFSVPVYVLDEKRATARVGVSVERELAEIARTRSVIIGLGLFVLTVGLAWAMYQARRVLEPVRALVEGTEEIARGNLDHRIAVTVGDELGQLALAFNRMTDSVQALIQTSRELCSVRDAQAVLESIGTHARTLAKADIAVIAPFDRDAQEAQVRVVLGARTDLLRRLIITPGRGMGGRVLATGEPMSTTHYIGDSGILHDPTYDRAIEEEGIASAIAVPIVLKGEIIGLLWVANRSAKPFSTEDVDSLGRMAHQAAIAMENARLYAETALKTARLESLLRVSQTITSTLDPHRIVEVVLRTMSELMDGIVVRLWEVMDGRSCWVATGGGASPTVASDEGAAMPAVEGLVRVVAEKGSPLVVEDLRDDERVDAALVKREGLIAFLGLPLLREDELLGVLCVATRTAHRFTREEVDLFASFAQQAAIALENAHLYQDLKRSHEDLATAQRDLVQKTRLAAMGEMAAAVAHEVRNPLGALTNCVQMLRNSSPLAEADGEILDILHAEAQRLNGIVSDFLAFGRPRPPQFEQIDLHELIDEALSLLRRDDRCSPRIRVVRDFQASLPAVRADRDQLRQVFWNLFLNAVQAMKDDGELSVRTRAVNAHVEVTVRDSGPGIPRATIPKVFEPFFTTKAGGTGLGLPIVRRIIESHGGRIAVDSEPEEGTCFVLSLVLDPNAN